MRRADLVTARTDCKSLADEDGEKVEGDINELELRMKSTCRFSMKYSQLMHKLMKDFRFP
jgi:hypothetical protein